MFLYIFYKIEKTCWLQVSNTIPLSQDWLAKLDCKYIQDIYTIDLSNHHLYIVKWIDALLFLSNFILYFVFYDL